MAGGGHRRRLQLRVGGLFCSFCAESVSKAYRHIDGVEYVKVSLAHEEVLIQYDPSKVAEEELRERLRQPGFTVWDAGKIRSFEEEEAELRSERRRLIIASGLTSTAAMMMAFMWMGYMQPWFKWLMMTLALATVLGPG